MSRGTEAEYHSAASLLTQGPLAGTPLISEMLPQVLNPDEFSIDWEALMPRRSSLSSGEIVLFDLAYALWAGVATGMAEIPNLVRDLDDESLLLGLEAIAMRRGLTLTGASS